MSPGVEKEVTPDRPFIVANSAHSENVPEWKFLQHIISSLMIAATFLAMPQPSS